MAVFQRALFLAAPALRPAFVLDPGLTKQDVGFLQGVA